MTDMVVAFSARTGYYLETISKPRGRVRLEAFVFSEDKITLQRKELYDQVWRTPMRTLAKEFGLSDVELAKIRKKYHIPRPGLGHWVRVERGHPPPRSPLPKIEDPKLERVEITIRERPSYQVTEPKQN